MAFYFYFEAEQALLWSVRYALKTWPNEEEGNAYLAVGSACVLSCAAAFEAIVNRIISAYTPLRHWDELRIVSKVDTISDLSGFRIEWGVSPWQSVAELIRVRNWLAHFKDPQIGLVGADEQWITDAFNKRPRIDPQASLSVGSIRQFYNAVREAGMILAECVGQQEAFDYLANERYSPAVFG